MPAIEITLRTPAALAAIEQHRRRRSRAPRRRRHRADPGQGERRSTAGAEFLVSPGTTPALLDACGSALLPGVATASEIVALLERGMTAAKFFPAEASGGVEALRAFAGPFPQVRFCPTGGIDAAKAPDYLALPNVACVGGSWMLRELSSTVR